MSKTFARLNKDIIIAIREGNGSDPDMNLALARCAAELPRREYA